MTILFKPILCLALVFCFAAANAQDTSSHNFENGTEYFKKGNYDSAIYYFTLAISMDTNKAESYNYRGLTYFNKEKYDSAILDYDAAIQLNSAYSQAFANKGNVYFKLNDTKNALVNYTIAVGLDSTTSQTFGIRGFVYTKLKNYEKAIKDYSKAIWIDSNYSFAYINRGYAYLHVKFPDADSALSDLNKAIILEAANSTAYAYRGIAYLLKNKYDSAIDDFTNAIRIDPGYSYAYSKRGETYYQLKKFDLAIVDYTNVIRLEPGNPTYFEIRSRIYFDKKQTDSAMLDINYAIKLDRYFAGYYHTRGDFYNLTGQYDSSVKDFKKCIQLDPAFGKAYINIISPLVRLNLFDTATYYYELYRKKNLVSFFDNDKYKLYRNFVTAVTLVSRKKMELSLTNIETALSQYNTAIKDEIKRAYLDLLFVKAYILSSLNRLDEAKQLYKQSLVLDPQQPNITNTLAVIEKKQVLTRAFDDKGPIIDLITPESTRGFDIVADNTVLEVTGTASDESGIDSVLINGVRAKVESNGYFMANLKLIASTKSLEITATDKRGNKTNKIILLNKNMSDNKDEKMEKLTYHAILIAEKDYTDINIPSLLTPINDARRLKNVLVNQYTFDPENIDTLFNKSRSEILEKFLTKASTLTQNDNLLIFYAGHGTIKTYNDDKEAAYLIPSDAVKDKTYQYIRSDELQELLISTKARHVLIILDACFSGALLRETPQSVPTDIKEQNKFASRKVMTSGNVEEVPDNSIFIQYLLKSLDENVEEYLSTNDIWKKIVRKVEDESNKQPKYIAIEGVGDKRGQFIFVRRKK